MPYRELNIKDGSGVLFCSVAAVFRSKFPPNLLTILVLILSLLLTACGGISEADEPYNAGVDQEQGRLEEAVGHYYAGVEHQEQGRLEEAAGEYDEAIRLNPQYANAYAKRGLAYYNLGQFELAIQDYDETIRLNPQDAKAYNNRAIAFAELDELERAIRDYDEAIRLNPQYATAYNNRAIAFAELDEFERAIQDYDEAIRLNSRYANAYANRGLAYYNLGQFERGIRDYDEAIRLNPQDLWAYNNRGLAYYSLDQFERAIQDYDEAIRLNPQDLWAYNNRGLAYYNLGQFERAIQDYDEAIRLNPQDVLAYNNRGLAYYNLGQFERAIQDYDEAIRLNSRYANAYANRAWARTMLGMSAEAQQDVEKAVSLGYDRSVLETNIEILKKQLVVSPPTTPSLKSSSLYIPEGQTLSGIIQVIGSTTNYFVETATLLAYGGAPLAGYTWSVASLSALPAGTTVDPLTGIFHGSGGILLPGTHTFKMVVSDGSTTATGSFSFVVKTGDEFVGITVFSQPAVSTIALPDANTGVGYGASLRAFGRGDLKWSWYLGTGELPPGLEIDRSRGIVWGTPFSSAAGNTYGFTITVKDKNGTEAAIGGFRDNPPTYTISVPK